MILRRILIAMLLLGLVACSQDGDNTAAEGEATAVEPTAPAADDMFEAGGSELESEQQAVLYDPVVMVMTNTPPAATATAEPTATAEATAVPPTNTPAPVQPTNPPPPPPTAVPPTEEPPPPPPPAIGANGLIASQFELQDRSDYVVNGKVWFEFTVANSTGNDVGYYSLGVMPKKDGVDRVEWYQQSYKGRNSTISPGGFSWEDNIRLPEAGDYTLRLVMCFDSYESCTTNSGTYQSLSNEIPITIRND
jgi:hypothetical protein